MATITTSHGPVDVNNWGYMLQGLGGKPLTPSTFAKAAHDLMVIDFSRDGTNALAFTPAQVAAMANGAGGEKVMVSYISIGEVSDFRDEWNPAWTTTGLAKGALTGAAPSWIGPLNPDWPESRKVRYWEQAWQDTVFNDAKTGWLDQIVKNGFDAAYLDIVDAYYFWAEEAPAGGRRAGDPAKGDDKDAAQRMIDFIVEMTEHARETNPDFFVILQNGDFIIDALDNTDPARKAALLDAIGGIAVEDVYLRNGSKDENNGFKPDEERIAVLKRDFLANGKFVLAVDYATQASKIGAFVAAAVEDGFLPFVAPDRDLDRLSKPLGTAAATGSADVWLGKAGADVFFALAGDDVLNGLAGADKIYGGRGKDTVFGGAGDDYLKGHSGADKLKGSSGNDTLNGGSGTDKLYGGTGEDTFVFADGNGKDHVKDFKNGVDTLLIKGLADSFAEVRDHASNGDGYLKIAFGDDKLYVTGLTLKTLTADDVLII